MKKNEFELLTFIENNPGKWTQENLGKKLNLSVGTINSIIKNLRKKESIVENNSGLSISKQGYKQLKPYKVNNAIIMAAGMGTRMLPLTLYTPKPLVIVKGKSMIERTIEILISKDITNIYIVIGYLKSRFSELKEKYPMINFIENKDFVTTNNISSVNLAKKFFGNSYLLEADIFIQNPNVIRKYEYESNCLGVFKERTDDWCYNIESDRIVNTRQGGLNCYEMCGISYWNHNDSTTLNNLLKKYYDAPGVKEQFIDTFYLNDFNESFNFYIRKCNDGDVLEFDTISDLKKFDELYDI